MGIWGILLTYAFFPFTLLLLVTCVPAIYRFTLCFLLNKPIQDKVLTPWEQTQN